MSSWSPRGLLASYIAKKLGEYFCVDNIETQLLNNARISLHGIQVQPPLQGSVELLEFAWDWGGPTLIQNVKVTVQGVRLRLEKACVDEMESKLSQHSSTDSLQAPSNAPPDWKARYLQQIMDGLTVLFQDLEFRIVVDETTEVVLTGSHLELSKTNDKILQHLKIQQQVNIRQVSCHVEYQQEEYTVLEPFAYAATIQRTSGERFGGLQGLVVQGLKAKNKVHFHVGSVQVQALMKLQQEWMGDKPETLAPVVAPSKASTHATSETNTEETELSMASSLLTLPFSSLALVLDENDTSIVLRSVELVCQTDGSQLSVSTDGLWIADTPVARLGKVQLQGTKVVVETVPEFEEGEQTYQQTSFFLQLPKPELMQLVDGFKGALGVYKQQSESVDSDALPSASRKEVPKEAVASDLVWSMQLQGSIVTKVAASETEWVQVQVDQLRAEPTVVGWQGIHLTSGDGIQVIIPAAQASQKALSLQEMQVTLPQLDAYQYLLKIQQEMFRIFDPVVEAVATPQEEENDELPLVSIPLLLEVKSIQVQVESPEEETLLITNVSAEGSTVLIANAKLSSKSIDEVTLEKTKATLDAGNYQVQSIVSQAKLPALFRLVKPIDTLSLSFNGKTASITSSPIFGALQDVKQGDSAEPDKEQSALELPFPIQLEVESLNLIQESNPSSSFVNAGKSILSLTPKTTEFELQVSSCVNVSLLDYVVADMLTASATGSLSSLDRPNAAKVSAAGVKVSQFPFNDLVASGTVPELGFTCGYADATSTGIVPPKFEAFVNGSLLMKAHGSELEETCIEIESPRVGWEHARGWTMSWLTAQAKTEQGLRLSIPKTMAAPVSRSVSVTGTASIHIASPEYVQAYIAKLTKAMEGKSDEEDMPEDIQSLVDSIPQRVELQEVVLQVTEPSIVSVVDGMEMTPDDAHIRSIVVQYNDGEISVECESANAKLGGTVSLDCQVKSFQMKGSIMLSAPIANVKMQLEEEHLSIECSPTYASFDEALLDPKEQVVTEVENGLADVLRKFSVCDLALQSLSLGGAFGQDAISLEIEGCSARSRVENSESLLCEVSVASLGASSSEIGQLSLRGFYSFIQVTPQGSLVVPGLGYTSHASVSVSCVDKVALEGIGWLMSPLNVATVKLADRIVKVAIDNIAWGLVEQKPAKSKSKPATLEIPQLMYQVECNTATIKQQSGKKMSSLLSFKNAVVVIKPTGMLSLLDCNIMKCESLQFADMVAIPSLSATACIDLNDLDTFQNLNVQTKKLEVTANFTVSTWADALTKSSEEHIIFLPNTTISEMEVLLHFDATLVSVEKAAMKLDAFKGDHKTTSEALSKHYVKIVQKRSIYLLQKANILGINVGDTLGQTAVMAATHTSVIGAVGGVLGKDMIGGAISKGKRSRGASNSDKYQFGDFSRGLLKAVQTATPQGVAKGTTEYASENRVRLSAATGSSVGMVAGLALAGPVGLVAGALIGSTAAGKVAEATITEEANADSSEPSSRAAGGKGDMKIPPTDMFGRQGSAYQQGPIDLLDANTHPVANQAPSHPTGADPNGLQYSQQQELAQTQQRNLVYSSTSSQQTRQPVPNTQQQPQQSQDKGGYKFGDFTRGLLGRKR